MRYFFRIKHIYIKYIRNHNEEPRFLILFSFLMTFMAARFSVYSIKYHLFGLKNIYIHQLHIHHLVFGIILLLIAGLIRVPQFGTSLIKLSSVFYGIGAALTLDEFALWLRLDANAYFGKIGRENLDAVVIFILIMLSIMWHGVFFKKVFQYTIKYTWNKFYSLLRKL